MAKLFIQDTTLTAIADAIRAKSGGAAEPQSFIAVHSPNTFGFGENDYDSSKTVWDEATGNVYEGSGFTTYSNTYEVHIPGATKLVVKISSFHNYSISASKKIEIRKGWFSEGNGSLFKTIYAVSEQTYEIASDKMSFYLQFTDNNTYTGYGFYAEVTGYDADGNLIMIGGASAASDVTYTPLEMPAAILAISGEGGGGITPSGEITFYDNGSYDVAQYASAVVNVEKGVFPEGDFPITENGQYNITRYNTVTVEVPTGGGTGDDIEYPVLSGPQQYTCQGNSAGEWAIKNFGSKITTSNLLDTSNMFANSGLTTIPVIFNYNTSSNVNINYMFQYAQSLTTLPEFSYIQPNNMVQLCYGCSKLINVNSLVDFDMTYMNTSSSGGAQSLFYTCRALRNIPAEFLKKFWALTTNSSRSHHNGAFTSCSSLDEVSNWGITTASLTSNTFQNTVSYCSCLKKFTFDTNDDGTAKTAKWKNQVIDLSAGIGYDSYKQLTSKYFSGGRDSSTEITDAASYETLKNNPNSWTKLREYSRYNKASAVETINSLPDCSAYIAGSTANNNTIKFEGAAGSATDAGAINTMTDAEIAVAAAKGWTVTFV
jgi:hypothetical protein